MNRPTGIYLNNINKKSFCNKNLHLYLKGSLNICLLYTSDAADE